MNVKGQESAGSQLPHRGVITLCPTARELGRGNSAIVFEHEGAEALKKLRPERCHREDDHGFRPELRQHYKENRQRFEAELHCGHICRSDHIVKVHARATVDGCPAIVMERLGPTLGQFIFEPVGPPRPEATIQHYLLGALRGLKDMHQKGYMHRDVNLDNVLLTRDERYAKLADLGSARRIRNTDSSMREQLSPAFGHHNYYTAPEAYPGKETEKRGEETYNESVDMYSFAVVALCALTGRLPFGGDEDCRNLGDRRDDVRQLADDHPWKYVIVRCLNTDARLRLSAADALAILEGPSPPSYFGVFLNRLDEFQTRQEEKIVELQAVAAATKQEATNAKEASLSARDEISQVREDLADGKEQRTAESKPTKQGTEGQAEVREINCIAFLHNSPR
eukprot:scpid80692/ scgid1602/ Serine/threonine-protein kinase D3; Protein kinase C nu type; nPKC-nu